MIDSLSLDTHQAKKLGLPFMKISSVTGEGIDELKRAMWDALEAAKAAQTEHETLDRPQTFA